MQRMLPICSVTTGTVQTECNRPEARIEVNTTEISKVPPILPPPRPDHCYHGPTARQLDDVYLMPADDDYSLVTDNKSYARDIGVTTCDSHGQYLTLPENPQNVPCSSEATSDNMYENCSAPVIVVTADDRLSIASERDSDTTVVMYDNEQYSPSL